MVNGELFMEMTLSPPPATLPLAGGSRGDERGGLSLQRGNAESPASRASQWLSAVFEGIQVSSSRFANIFSSKSWKKRIFVQVRLINAENEFDVFVFCEHI
jgi:hypothetical protein